MGYGVASPPFSRCNVGSSRGDVKPRACARFRGDGRLPPVTGRPSCLLAIPASASALALLFAAAMLLMGCTPNVGDHCNLNTDCSLQGTLVCDNSQPNGYCTRFNCAPNTCPAGAACVLLYSEVPGCPYDGYSSPSRTQRTVCMKNLRPELRLPDRRGVRMPQPRRHRRGRHRRRKRLAGVLRHPDRRRRDRRQPLGRRRGARMHARGAHRAPHPGSGRARCRTGRRLSGAPRSPFSSAE